MRKRGFHNTERPFRRRSMHGIINQDRTTVVQRAPGPPLANLPPEATDQDAESAIIQRMLAQQMLAHGLIAQEVNSQDRVSFFAAFFRHTERKVAEPVVIEEKPAWEPTPIEPALALEAPGRELVTDAEAESDLRGGKAVKEFPTIVCPRCGSCRIRRARRSNAFEQVLRLFALAPYRCRACRHKFYRFWRPEL